MKILYTNCDSLSNKFEELEMAVKINNPTAIILTEVTPKNARYALQKSEIELQGYQLYVNDFSKKGNRGIAIYVKNSIYASQICMKSVASDTVWVEIMLEKKKKMLLGGVYRSPNNSHENNLLLWATIKKVSERYKNKLLIVGDFNCKDINWESGTTNDDHNKNPNNALLKTCRECYLEQIVDQNTRARGENIPSLIDLILCYDASEVESLEYLSPIGKSDHCMLLFEYVIICEKKIYKVKKMFYDKANYGAIKEKLSNINWEPLFYDKSVQEQWDIFDNHIKACEIAHVPSKIIDRNRDSKYKDLLPDYIRQKI